MLKFTKNDKGRGYTSACGRFSIHHPRDGYTEDGTWMVIDSSDPLFGNCDRFTTKRACIAEANEWNEE